MPVRKTKNTPRTFRGDAHSVEYFLDHLEQLFAQHRITDSQEKCRHLIKYCSHNVEGFIKLFPTFGEDYESDSEDIASLPLTTTCTATATQQPHFPIASALQHASGS